MPHNSPDPAGSLRGHMLKGGAWAVDMHLIVMLAQLLTLPLVERLLGTPLMGVYL